MTRYLRGRATEWAPYFALVCFAAAALLSLAAPIRPGPAMWTARGADPTLYLVVRFGGLVIAAGRLVGEGAAPALPKVARAAP